MTKNKLEIIADSLEKDSRVIVLPYIENNADELRRCFVAEESPNSTLLSTPGTHKVHFYVAPVNALYTARELQSFMESILPEVKPSEINRFSQDVDYSPENFLGLGSLNFRESYGREKITIQRICEINDDLFANNFNFKDGKKTVEEERKLIYERVIQVKVYPNEEIGVAALEKYKDETNQLRLMAVLNVDLNEIQKYAPNIVKELIKSGEKRFI